MVSGCCPESVPRVEPVYPKSVTGWLNNSARNEFMKEYGFWSRGDFIIEKDASIDNGRVGLRVVDLIPPNSCCEAADVNCRAAKAVISFTRMSDKTELCRMNCPEGSSTTVECRSGLNELGVIGVRV